MTRIEELRKKLENLKEKFEAGNRNGLVLTLVAVTRLLRDKKHVSLREIVEEAKRILHNKNIDVDWGVANTGYDESLASTLVRELIDMGVLEEVDGRLYRFKKYEDGDPRAEIYARFGYLILYGGPAR